MKLIWKYLMKYKKWFLLDFISVFGFALVELGIPTIISDMIDHGIEMQNTSYLYSRWLLMAVISVIGVSGVILLGYCCAKISTNITRDIRNDVFEHSQTFSAAEMEKFGVSSMITRTNNDAYQIMLFLNTILRSALLTPVMICVSVLLILKISLKLSYVVLATIPIVILGVIIVAKVSEPISENQQNSIDHINQILRENITGIRVIRSFNKQEYEKKRFRKENDFYRKQSSNLFKLMSCTEPSFFFLMNIATILVYYLSCRYLDANAITLGNVVAFVEYLFHVMMSVLIFCMVFMLYPRANVSAKRIMEVLDTKPSIQNEKDCLQLDTIQTLTFKNVGFSYPNGEEAVLKNIDFSCHAGQKVAVIGSTGSGKSTLVKLINRFYDVSKGCIELNGVDIRKYSLESVRDQIGYVAQKAHMFKGSIRSNISFSKPDASLEEVNQAASIAQASEFILKRENGYEDEIAEDGTNISGGQKQRLSIARVILKKPSLYIYDDSFSALDFKTDAALRKALKPEVKNAIFFVVAQRISTIMDSDMILVLNEGQIVGCGTHVQLLKNCPVYQEIAHSQLTQKELDDYERK